MSSTITLVTIILLVGAFIFGGTFFLAYKRLARRYGADAMKPFILYLLFMTIVLIAVAVMGGKLLHSIVEDKAPHYQPVPEVEPIPRQGSFGHPSPVRVPRAKKFVV